MNTYMAWMILIGSWCVPVATLLIGFYMTHKYQLKLIGRAEAMRADTKAEVREIVNEVERDLNALKIELNEIKKEIINEIPEIPESFGISEEEIRDLREQITKTIDGKLGSMVAKMKRSMKKEIETADEATEFSMGSILKMFIN